MLPCKLQIAAFLSLGLPGLAWAADPVAAANFAGQGSTLLVAHEDNAALTANPSVIALTRRYDIQAMGALGPSGGSGWGASIVDNQTSPWLALGFVYSGRRSEPALLDRELPAYRIPGEDVSNVRRRHDMTLALSGSMLERRLAVGVSGTLQLFNNDRDGDGAVGDLDVGISGHATPWLVLGAAGRNLVPSWGGRDLPLAVGGGARVHTNRIAVGAQAEWLDQKADLPVNISGGLDLPLGAVPRIRGGYRYEGKGQRQWLTTGVGFVGPDGSFDFSALLPLDEQISIGSVGWGMSMNLRGPVVETAPF